jgi:hypothetical protein
VGEEILSPLQTRRYKMPEIIPEPELIPVPLCNVTAEQITAILSKLDSIIATLVKPEVIKYICTRCKGTGKMIQSLPGQPVQNIEVDCVECNGLGYRIFGEANEE